MCIRDSRALHRPQFPGGLLGGLPVPPAAVRESEALAGLQGPRFADQDVADRAGAAAPVGGRPALDEHHLTVAGDRAHHARPGGGRTGHPQQRPQFPAQFLGALGRAGVGDGLHAGALAALVAVPAEDHLVHLVHGSAGVDRRPVERSALLEVPHVASPPPDPPGPTANASAPPGTSISPCMASSDSSGSSTRRGPAPAG